MSLFERLKLNKGASSSLASFKDGQTEAPAKKKAPARKAAKKKGVSDSESDFDSTGSEDDVDKAKPKTPKPRRAAASKLNFVAMNGLSDGDESEEGEFDAGAISESDFDSDAPKKKAPTKKSAPKKAAATKAAVTKKTVAKAAVKKTAAKKAKAYDSDEDSEGFSEESDDDFSDY